jgi:hypothetical protein
MLFRFFDRTAAEHRAHEADEEYTDEQWREWNAQQGREKRQRVAAAQAYDAHAGFADTYYSRIPTPPATAPPGYMAPAPAPAPNHPGLATYIDDNGVLYTGPSGLKLAGPAFTAPPPQYAAPPPQYADPPPQYAAPKMYAAPPSGYLEHPSYAPPLPPPNYAPTKYIARPQHAAPTSQHDVGPSAAAGGQYYQRDDNRASRSAVGSGDARDAGDDQWEGGHGKGGEKGKGRSIQKGDKGGDKGYRATSSSAEGKGASSSEWNEDIQKYQKTGWLNKCSDLVTLVLRGEAARAQELAKFYANSSSMFPLLPSDVKNSL